MMFSVRIVNSDFYLADPIANLDAGNSEDATVSKVPVIRIYGATPSGQKTCLHVHGIFPYIYVPYDGTQPTNKYLKQFATSVDFAVQVALGRASSSRQHVFEITVVKGIPYYGYHEGERDFLKIVLCNPFLVTRVVSLLQNGAIMNKVFQPHEAHIPYLLQFFMDYNLYGMNLLHVSAVKFRSPVRLLDGEVGTVTSSIQRSNSPQSTPTTFAASRAQIWNEDTISRDWVLGSDVERLSFCELEVDVLASDILNKLEIGVNVGTNPGLAAIWEDEQQRRREANESSQISAPPTQERGFIKETETENKFKERIREIIEERDVLIQSQMGKLGREALSPQELASFQDSISSFAACQKDLPADISSDANALLQLLSQTADDSIAESSQVVIDEDEPVVNRSIVQEVVEASQRSFSQDLSSSLDKEMVDILTSLAEESSQPGNQKPALSQSILLDQGDAELDEEANDDEELSEADESIMMSQRVWDDIEPQLAETGDEEIADVQENDNASQRVSQYDLNGMSDTWVGSFLGGDIPQLDGAADEDFDGKEDFKVPQGERRKGNPRYQADKMSKRPEVMLLVPRGNSQRVPVNPEESGRNMEGGKTEERGEPISVDVWPQAARAIRTYSRKGMSVLKSQSSATFQEVDSTAKKNNKDLVVVDNEKEMGNRTKIEDCKDEFRLFISESSDSEDNMTKEANLGSKRNDVIGRQRNDPSVKQCEAIKRNSSIVRKDQGTSDESYTPVITKYFHSPEKNTEHVRKQSEEMNDPTGSNFTVGENSLVQMSPHCSQQCHGYSRKSTLRKRKLPEFGDKSERRLSKRTSLRRTRQNTDLAASLNAVSGAMADLKVVMKDVSDTPALSSKLDEAQKRLRRRRENLCENFTHLNQKLSILARKERLPGTSSPLRLGKNEISPLSKKRCSPTRSSNIDEAQKRLRGRRENPCDNFTHLNQKLSSLARKERLPGTSSPPRLGKNEMSPLSKKRRCPIGKEERMKKYGNLPVVIAKSPKKNFTVDSVAPDTLLLTEAEKCLRTDSTCTSSQSPDEPSIHSSQAPCVFPVTHNSGTGRVSSRSRTRVSGLFSSRTIATATAEDKKETSPSVPLSSRELSLKPVSRSRRDKSHGEKGRVLSLHRKGLKRKLKLDTERDVQLATVKILPGVRKKRKLSLTLKEDKSRSDLREEGAGETFASLAENRLIEEYKSICEAKDEMSNTRHVGFDIGNNDSSLRSGNGKDFALNTGLSDDIICIPSSPGDSDSNNESPNRSGSSASVAESTSFPVSTETCNKSEDELNASVSDKREHRPLEKLNSLTLVSRETFVSEEKDTELLANALFNMSYLSPLPCLEECHSPPSPSSPLDVKRDTSDPRNQHNMVKQQKFFSENISIVEEDGRVSDDVELKRLPASCLSQVQQTAFFSPADIRLREKSLQLQIRPQLGETQSQFESTSSEYNDANVSKQLECKSTENEDSANSFDQRVDDKEMSCDKESLDSRENLKNEARPMEERRKDSEFNSDPAVLEEKSRGHTIACSSESHKSFAGLKSPNSVRTESLIQTSRTHLAESEEQSSINTVENEFVLELSTAEDISSNSQPLVRGDLQTREMELSAGEENQVQEISSESMPNANSPASPIISQDHNKAQIRNTPVKQSDPSSSSLELKGIDRLGYENLIAIEPLRRPPTSQELINSLKDYGLPHCRYQAPFCSDPDDIPACPREVGGRVLRIESKQVSNLPEFESSSSLQGLKHWRFVLSSARECSVRDIFQNIEDATNIDQNFQLKMALMAEGEVVITPCRGPPAYEAVKAWAREKLAKRGSQKQETDPTLKKLELKKSTSNDGNLENVEEKQLSEQRNVDLVVSGTSKIKLGQAMPVTSTSKVPPEEVTTQARHPSVNAEFEPLVENKHKTLDVDESERRLDVMESSDSSSPVEVTSPCSLFSPNELKTFTFAPGTPQEIAQRKSVKGTQAENQYLNTITDTQPMHIDEALPLSARSDKQFSEPKNALTLGPSSVTVTPSALHSPDGSSSTTKQPLSPILQSQCPVFAAPYHSTPVATKLIYGVQSPRCTPISDATKAKRFKTNAETDKKSLGNQASSDQTPLRQRLLSSQFKFVSPGSEPRRPVPWSSQIEGPSPNNTFGFKVTQVNLKDAKALHEVQHLTLFSLELHVRTRRDARPDPEFDPICAIFYYIQTDTSLASGKNKMTGIICVDSESFKITSSKTENKDRSISNTETSALLSPSSDAVASTSNTNNISVSRTAQNLSTSHLRPLLSRSGVTDHEVQYVAEEKDLFPALIKIIRKWDPDILIGYEVQMFSWGFLLERALAFEIDLCTWLSRVKGSSSASNMDAEKDQWGAAHTSEIKIAGRIILNVWRLMRHEVTLNSYSFENVAFHVLHERIPLYTFRTLSDWWDQRTSLNRWRTVDHYVRRCRGNVRILESVDFIGRTSELARLFGILFFSVICRGSQYRVESMMLRIAKPMNYIAVSPSVEQRGLMRAPETIPLVMEPESRFYSDPVLVLDFQSLYPSMIIAYNYCFSTCLGRVSCLSEYGEFKFGATSLCVPPSVLKKLEGDIHVCPNGVAFVKSNVRRGILPSMLDEILQTRIMVKASMKRWKSDKSLGRMLDARQLGLKLIANVTFGYTSAHFSGRMPCVEIGDSIVRKARETLERAIDLVNNTPRWGARVVYGDTDSLFVLLKGATKDQAFNIGKDIVDTVTAMNPKPVKLKFEKVYLPCVLQTKKRYVGYMYETLDQKEPVFDAKGIETVRRDSCPAVAKVLEKSLRFLFETRDLSLIKKFVQRQCTKLMEGRASLQDFTFAKEYRGMKNYKPGACVPALELTRRMLREDRRSEPRVGERVPYVVVYGSPGLPLIQLVRRPHEVLQDPGLRLNASYYITKQILPPLNRVFSLIGLDVFTWYADLPRVVRVAQMPTDPGDRKKGTISQYFSTMMCPVCQELTPADLCAKCRARPQLSAVSLASRMRKWERTHQHLAEICYSCCGSRDTKLSCVSLDCPVFYKLVLCTRDLKSSQHFRRILDSL